MVSEQGAQGRIEMLVMICDATQAHSWCLVGKCKGGGDFEKSVSGERDRV